MVVEIGILFSKSAIVSMWQLKKKYAHVLVPIILKVLCTWNIFYAFDYSNEFNLISFKMFRAFNFGPIFNFLLLTLKCIK